MTKEQLNLKIKEYYQRRDKTADYVEWNNTILEEWEYKLLLDIGAISPTSIKRDISLYSFYKKIRKENRELADKRKYAERINTPPIEAYNNS